MTPRHPHSLQEGSAADMVYTVLEDAQQESATPVLSQARFRLIVVVAVFLLGYFAVALRLVDLTLLTTHPSAGQEGAATASGAPVLRGQILDRNGDMMATSLRVASVYADATLISDPQQAAKALAPLLSDVSQDHLIKNLSSGRRFVWLARNITPRQEYAVNSLGIPGIGFKHQYRRIYPHGRLTAHILGYTDVDGHGIAGMEKSLDHRLAADGEDVQLTIDLRIQHILHRELSAAMRTFSAKAAVGMVMDIETGEIIALVSLPDFDPHHPGEASPDALFNRATLGVFEMGSTFKLFPVAAALEAGTANFATQLDARAPIKIGRYTISDYHAEKRMMSLPEVFIHSSNIGTARLALGLGHNKLRDFYEEMGFDRAAPVDLPERGVPLFPKTWRDVTTITASFGYGVAVSPLHLMRGAAALTNGGYLIKPYLTLRPEDARVKRDGPRVVSDATTQKILELLELTVAAGTGSKAAVEGYEIGGKTGTAEKSAIRGYDKNAVLSSFLAVYPIRAPKYAVLAMIDEPKPTKETFGYATGGWTAAPVVGRVIAQMAPLYQIPPQPKDGHDIKTEMARYLKDATTQKQGGSNEPVTDH